MSQTNIRDLSRRLRDPEFVTRRDAADTLVEIGDENAMRVFLKACTDKREKNRDIAAYGLSKMGDERAIEPLLKGLARGADWSLWNNTHLAFIFIGEPAVVPIIEALHDPRFPNWDTRCFAFIQSLGKIGDERALDPLIKLLIDPSEKNVHHAVAAALGDIGDPEATGALIWAVEQYPDSPNYVNFIEALSRLKDPIAFDTFVGLLGHERDRVRRWAIKGLGLIGDPRAIPILEPFCSDSSFEIRDWAIRALGDIWDESAVELLEIALSDPNKEIRKRAKKSLSKIGTDSALRVLDFIED